jgi:hypothetical protein
LLAVYTAITFDAKRAKLFPGEHGAVICLACDKAQAGIVFDYIKGLFEEVPALRALVKLKGIGAETIELKNRVTVAVHANSSRAVRGRRIIAAIFDEAAFFRSDEFANPDTELDAAVSPSLARTPGSIKIIISSVHKRSGLLYQKWVDHYGKDDEDTLVIAGTTLQFNPLFDAKIIERDIAKDPERYGAEYLSRWRDDISTFLPHAVLTDATDKGVVQRRPVTGVNYTGAVDAAGGRGADAFTVAIAHRELDETVVLDLVQEWKPPFSASEAISAIASILREYNVTDVSGDAFGFDLAREAFARNGGIRYHKSERNRSAVYSDLLPLLTSGKVRLLDHKRLFDELGSLERRTSPEGRDKIVPGPYHDDLATSASLALTTAVTSLGGLVTPRDFLVDGAPIKDIGPVLYRTLAVDKEGRIAVASWAWGKVSNIPPCYVELAKTGRHPHLYPPTWIGLTVSNFETGRASDQKFKLYESVASLCFKAATANLVGAVAFSHYEVGARDVVTDLSDIVLPAASFVKEGLVKVSRSAHEKGFSAPLIFQVSKMHEALSAAIILGVACGVSKHRRNINDGSWTDPSPGGRTYGPGGMVNSGRMAG